MLIVVVRGLVWYYGHSGGSFGLVYTVSRSEDLDQGWESIEYKSHSRIISGAIFLPFILDIEE